MARRRILLLKETVECWCQKFWVRWWTVAQYHAI